MGTLSAERVIVQNFVIAVFGPLISLPKEAGERERERERGKRERRVGGGRLRERKYTCVLTSSRCLKEL